MRVVSIGEFIGKTLKKVLELCPNYVGSHPKTDCNLLILVKIIDAKLDFSCTSPSG